MKTILVLIVGAVLTSASSVGFASDVGITKEAGYSAIKELPTDVMEITYVANEPIDLNMAEPETVKEMDGTSYEAKADVPTGAVQKYLNVNGNPTYGDKPEGERIRLLGTGATITHNTRNGHPDTKRKKWVRCS